MKDQVKSAARERLDRRSLMKSIGAASAVTLASFAGCAGSNNQETTTTGGDGTTDEPQNAVQMDGFKVPADNVVSKSELSDEQRFAIDVLVPPPKNTPDEYDTMKFWADSSSELGLDISLETLPQQTQIEQVWYTGRSPKVKNGKIQDWWQVTSWRFGPRPSRLDPDELLYNVHHSSRQAGYNFHFWEDEEFDKVVEQQRKTVDKKKRQKLVKQCQKILHERGPDIVYMFPDAFAAWNSDKWKGVVNIDGLGPANLLTFSNLEPQTDDKVLVSIDTASDELQYLTAFASAGRMDMRTTRMMYDRLMWPNKDGLARPRLATEVNYKDKTTIEVPIRKGHKFWNGQNLLAQDVKFTYKVHRDMYDTHFTASVEPIEEIEIADDHRLIFHLKNPFAPIELFTFARVGIESKKHWEEIFDSDHFKNSSQAHPSFYNPKNNTFLGSGPMKFGKWNKGEGIRLERYDDHFDPIAYEARVDNWVPNVSTAIAQLQQGEADIISNYTGDPSVLAEKVKQAGHLSMESSTNVSPQFIVFNNDYPPNHLDEFRRALSHRLDKEVVVNDIWDGWGKECRDHLISPGLEYWYNDSLEPHAFDLQAAANKLASAGFLWDEQDGRLWMPEDETKLSQAEVKHAENAGFNRDPVKK